MRRVARLQARLLVLGLCVSFAGAVATAGGTGTPRAASHVDALRHENAALAKRKNGALLELYSLEAELRRARSNVSALHAQRAHVAGQRQLARIRLDLARHDLRTSQRHLATLVRTAYEQETTDPLAVMLGSESLDEALSTLEELARLAERTRAIVRQSRDARTRLDVVKKRLARDDERFAALEAAAMRSEASLARAQVARRDYVSELASRRQVNATSIRRIETRALASVQESTAQAVVAEPAASLGNHTVTVVATGYSTGGSTATGLPAGWGIVAVDPAVIPLGTSLTVPGYGHGVAADTGSAVGGAAVDLWFPTASARPWGRRVITVTLH